MDPVREFAQLQLHFVDRLQWRYELIRPLVLFADRTPKQRAEETQTHIETVRELTRRFHKQGMLGLLPDDMAIVPKGKATRVPPTVVEELARLKALNTGFAYRELARIIFCTLGYCIHHQTIKKLWQHSPGAVQGELALGDYHSQPERYEACLQVIKLFAQGWTKRSISRVLHVSRPTIDRWLHRFAAKHFAGLEDRSRAPKVPARKVWFALMIDVYHWQKRHPDAGEFRIWSLLGNMAISVRTVGRIMALNRQVYADIPGGHRPRAKHPPQPHPYKATHPHEFWFIDGRKMDFALDGVRWWSLIVLDDYSPHHARWGSGPHRSQLGRADGPLYRLSALWCSPVVNLRQW